MFKKFKLNSWCPAVPISMSVYKMFANKIMFETKFYTTKIMFGKELLQQILCSNFVIPKYN